MKIAPAELERMRDEVRRLEKLGAKRIAKSEVDGLHGAEQFGEIGPVLRDRRHAAEPTRLTGVETKDLLCFGTMAA